MHERVVSFTERCALYGMSRVTGYKWLERANAPFNDSLVLTGRPASALRSASCPGCTAASVQASYGSLN
jgi:hypothetical protein